ncbi:MAG: class D beta-lactamase [Deltaproteobacteria bacterium]|nr:class D beta-lactamase [Deltaproteobacteria bacterium]
MRFLLVILMMIWNPVASASEWKENPKVEAVFSASNVIGTFVLYDAETNSFTGYNKKRAETRFIPASTYKIPNTLIGLTVGAVNSVDVIFSYDGKPQPVASWEKDMSLREAIKISCVPVYQRLARKIGLEKMRAELARLDYGNNETGASVDSFWLEGPLAISPVEQTRFLARLAQRTLALPETAQAQVREIVFMEQGATWSLFAKTGTVARCSPNIGWWVGWVEKEGKIYVFALNIELPQGNGAPDRISIGKQCLTALEIID